MLRMPMKCCSHQCAKESAKYVLCLRGVFKTSRLRRRSGQGSAAAEPVSMEASIDEAGKKALRETLEYVKPYLRA